MSKNGQIRGCRTSAIQLATKCPFACVKIYKDKLVGFKNNLALFGTTIHNVLEEYGARCLGVSETDYSFFDSILHKHVATLPEELQEEAIELLEKLRERVNFGLANSGEVAEAETRFYLDKDLNIIDDEENYYFTSGIDLYYVEAGGETAHVFDYKSSRQIFSPTTIKSNLQKDFYSFLIFQKYPTLKEVNFYFDFVRYGYLTPPTVFTRDNDYEKLKQKLQASCEQYYNLLASEEEPEARPSGFCGLCEVRGTCPAVNNAIVPACLVTDQASAIKAARQLKAAKLFIKELEDGLKSFVTVSGNVPISATEQYGITKSEKTEIQDKQGLMKALKDANVPMGAIFDLVSIAKGKVEKLIKKSAPDIDLNKFVVKRATTKYEYKDLDYDDSEPTETDG